MNVLVTGAGAIIGYGIIEALRKSAKNVSIIATDIYAENYGKYRCDKFYQVPYTNSPEYESFFNKILEINNIDLVIPGIEQDVFYYNENHRKFNTRFVLNKYNLIDLCSDKMRFFEFLNQLSFQDLIPTHLNLNFDSAYKLFGLPFIIKPKKSYASKGFHVINSNEDFLKIQNEIDKDTIFQPFVGSDDEEYTISVFGDGKGGYLDSIILRRYLSSSGASEKTFVKREDKDLMESISSLTKIFKPIGPTNFQYRKTGNKVFLLEVNPRISSTCSIRAKFGYNEPLYCLEYFFENKKISIGDKKYGKAIRYISDEIIYE